MNEAGKVLHCRRYENTRQEVLAVLVQCQENPSVVIKATQNWIWLVSIFQEFGVSATLAHPLKTKAIASARIKNDILDTTTLARLLGSNLVPSSYIATSTKANLHPPMTDLFGTKGQAWLRK